ncbi:SPOR domain-containing protein [Qipengyuania vesicularis]|uniref:SPOR domain-containing protein n=1 Tax=Qipengyuania vesicularis TaxID=2867232 RepID=UPI001C86E061|nr:SPOR domain-containing protein [Qipengyuania vesicularis]MBX7527589.1 tetratricopeptide repeat protein [Qipengyuania vesicularis]
MTTRNHTFVRLAVTTALATTALAGCTGKVAPSFSESSSKAEVALKKGKADKAVTHAEAAVLASPRDAYSRTLLGNAYLEAGRFASAAQTFQDAIDLGDTSPRTVVSLSLALTGMGDRAGAIYALERHEAALDPADFGLAVALAGQPQRGVHVLSNALRGGQNTAKVRQNLAYAYAMSGQWREARIMVSEDVPADKVGERMAEWGALARPEYFRVRVASLLGVQIAEDQGQPAQLALNNNPSVDMLAAETLEADPVEEPAPDFAFAEELPATKPEEAPIIKIDLDDPALVEDEVAPQPVVIAALAEEPKPAEAAAPVAAPAKAPAPVAASAERKPAAAAPRLSLAEGDYNIQLGSYFTMEDALEGWRQFQAMYPELEGAERVISKARVNGKIYYRVAAANYAKDSARSMCSSVKGKGGGCIAYAQSNPLPGQLDSVVRVAAR